MYPESLYVYMTMKVLTVMYYVTACVTGLTDMLIHCKKNANKGI